MPAGIAQELRRLGDITTAEVAQLVDELKAMPSPAVTVYRNDDEYHAAFPSSSFPASWHRAVVARAAQEIVGLAIDYPAPAAGGNDL